MTSNKKYALVLASVIGSCFPLSVFAADLPAAKAPAPVFTSAVYDWTAFYVGLGGASSWGRTNNTEFNTLNGAVTGAGNASGQTYHIVGQVGYDYMFASRIVVGAAFAVATGSSSSSWTTNAAGALTSITKDNSEGSGTISGRVGYGFDRVLAYVRGGYQWSNTNFTRTQILGTVGLATPGTIETATRSRSGWTLGGGLEYAIMNNLSVFAEYKYTNYGNASAVYGVAQRSVVQSSTVNTVLAGVNYRFNVTPSAVVARY